MTIRYDTDRHQFSIHLLDKYTVYIGASVPSNSTETSPVVFVCSTDRRDYHHHHQYACPLTLSVVDNFILAAVLVGTVRMITNMSIAEIAHGLFPSQIEDIDRSMSVWTDVTLTVDGNTKESLDNMLRITTG